MGQVSIFNFQISSFFCSISYLMGKSRGAILSTEGFSALMLSRSSMSPIIPRSQQLRPFWTFFYEFLVMLGKARCEVWDLHLRYVVL